MKEGKENVLFILLTISSLNIKFYFFLKIKNQNFNIKIIFDLYPF